MVRYRKGETERGRKGEGEREREIQRGEKEGEKE